MENITAYDIPATKTAPDMLEKSQSGAGPVDGKSVAATGIDATNIVAAVPGAPASCHNSNAPLLTDGFALPLE